jgi:hypothetical protein
MAKADCCNNVHVNAARDFRIPVVTRMCSSRRAVDIDLDAIAAWETDQPKTSHPKATPSGSFF